MNLPAPAESLCLAHMAAEQAAGGSNEQLFLYIGLTNGVCQRVSSHGYGTLESAAGYVRSTYSVLNRSLSKYCCSHGHNIDMLHANRFRLTQVAVDATAGTLADPRQRFLGSKPVKLFRIQVQDKRGVSSTGLTCKHYSRPARKWHCESLRQFFPGPSTRSASRFVLTSSAVRPYSAQHPLVLLRRRRRLYKTTTWYHV